MVIWITFCVFVIMSMSSLLVDSTDPLVQKLRYMQILFSTWMLFISFYFNGIFISSVTTLEVQKNKDVFDTAFTNSLYGLGSASYAALIIAFIVTLQAMISDATRTRDGEKDPIFWFYL